MLERDRQENRRGPAALAPPWWEYFNFQIEQVLVDDVDQSIFGAIYEFKCPCGKNSSPQDPNVVIAFRGTNTKSDSVSRDLQLNLHILKHELDQSSRCSIAMQTVRNVVATVGASKTWLVGHSLGSAMAMLAGRDMAKVGLFLETFLFNPPFFSAPIERIKDKKLKQGLRIANSFFTAGVATVVAGRNNTPKSEDTFAKLSPWFPNLYVNPRDHVSSEYVGYFDHRVKMEEIGGQFGRLATQNSIGSLIQNAFGKESEPPHLIPSANLTVNMSHSPDFKTAHGIHQWWRQDLNLKFKRYEYK